MENEKKIGKKISGVKAFALVCKQLEGEELSTEEYELVENSINNLIKHHTELTEIDVNLDKLKPVDSKSMKEALMDIGKALHVWSVEKKESLEVSVAHWKKERKEKKEAKRLMMEEYRKRLAQQK